MEFKPLGKVSLREVPGIVVRHAFRSRTTVFLVVFKFLLSVFALTSIYRHGAPVGAHPVAMVVGVAAVAVLNAVVMVGVCAAFSRLRLRPAVAQQRSG